MARLAHPNFLKAWREHRGLTPAELADAARTTGWVISLFDVRPVDLTTSDPNKGR
jgi:hypothetical protein